MMPFQDTAQNGHPYVNDRPQSPMNFLIHIHSREEEDEAAAAARLDDFLALVWPEITSFIPGPAAK